MQRLTPFLLQLSTTTAVAQVPPSHEARIRDNSFLVEEAYNQGPGIVQHISTFARAARNGGWWYSFTQEWPLPGQRHQLSYVIPVSRTDEISGGSVGLGDVAVHYRYQVGEGAGQTTAFAPRLSVILPSGMSRRGLGAGGFGVQFNLPFSAELPAGLVTHSNAGATYTARARDADGSEAVTVDVTLGQSVIWLVRPRLNLMLEAAWSGIEEVVAPGRTERRTEMLLSPGIRGAVDLRSGFQIVPGLAFPLGIGQQRGERTVFVYLSLEHPFAKQTP